MGPRQAGPGSAGVGHPPALARTLIRSVLVRKMFAVFKSRCRMRWPCT